MDRRLELEYIMLGLRKQIADIAHALTGAENGLSRPNMRAKVNSIILRLDKMDEAEDETLNISAANMSKYDQERRKPAKGDEHAD